MAGQTRTINPNQQTPTSGAPLTWDPNAPANGYSQSDAYGDVAKGAMDWLGLSNDTSHLKAAEGAHAASGLYGQLGQDTWGRSMEGMNRATGAYGGSQGLYEQMYSTPGAQQTAFNAYGGQLVSPSSSSGAYNQMNQYAQQGPMTYGAMNRASGMAGGTVDYSGLTNQLNGYGEASRNYQLSQGQYRQPGAMENFYQQNQQAMNRQPNSMATYDNFSGQLYAPGRAEQFQPKAANAGEMHGAAGIGRLGGASAIDNMAGEIGGYARSANDVNQFSAQNMGKLQNAGIYEDFVKSDIMGNNPAMKMEQDEGMAAINQEMARRGHFKSGGADNAIGKFAGTMAAKSYENRAQRAKDAQGMELSRLGQGQSLAQAASSNKLAQGQSLLGLGTNQESARSAREGLMLENAKMMSGEQMGNQRLSLDAATAADSSRNARLNTLTGMATAGDQSWQDQQQMAGNFANQAQNAQMSRLQGGMQAGAGADAGQLARNQAQYGMADQANNQNLQRGQFQYDMGTRTDQNDLSRMMGLNSTANANDQTQLARLNSYFDQAGIVDQRQKDSLMQLMGLDGARAGIIGDAYNQGNQLSSGYQADSINALNDYYSIMAGGQAANHGRGTDLAMDVYSTATSGRRK
jgi:hypothetical protein